MRSLLLSIDIGTESSRACLMTEDGRPIATASTEYDLVCPRPGWAEQDPMEWWLSTVHNIRRVVSKARVDSSQIAAIGVAGQMHAPVPLGPSGELLSNNVLLWCDKRSATLCDKLKERVGDDTFLKATGNALLPSWTGLKILWLKKHNKELYDATWKFVSCKDFINFMFTGEIGTDFSEASGTYLMDSVTKTWSPELCEALGIDMKKLPPIFPSDFVIGKIADKAAEKTGLREGTPVVSGGGDMMCLLLGAGVTTTGRACDITGTAADISVFVPEPLFDKRLMHLHHVASEGWISFGILDAGGGSLKWFKDAFGAEEVSEASRSNRSPYSVLSSLADTIVPGSEGLLFLPYLQGERTLGSSHSRGVFFGMSYRHTKAHFVRAIMEGVSFDLQQSLEIIKEKGIRVDSIRAVGGGACSPLWCEIKANVYGYPLLPLAEHEGGILGAAILAGLGVGIYNSATTAVDKIVRVREMIKPTDELRSKYATYYRFFKELHDGLQPYFSKSNELI